MKARQQAAGSKCINVAVRAGGELAGMAGANEARDEASRRAAAGGNAGRVMTLQRRVVKR